MFPVIGFLRIFVSLGVIWMLFGRHLDGHVIQRVPSPSSAPLTRVQRRALYILLAGVGLWATDLLHHIQPAYVGLGPSGIVPLAALGPAPFWRLSQGALRTS